MNKVVARYTDGRMVKGMTTDFSASKDILHVSVEPVSTGTELVEVQTKDLKALLFVKDFAGDPRHFESFAFSLMQPPAGRRVRVVFKDGETMVWTTVGYRPGRRGFFVVPADPESNNERCYVVEAATREISFL